jgi:hypothetical protein
MHELLGPISACLHNGVNTLLAVSTNIETEQITNGNLKLKGNSSFENLFLNLNS